MFAEGERKGFPIEVRQRIEYKPRDPSDTSKPLVMEGEVISVKAGFAFVSVPGFGEMFCPGSKYDGLIMERGLKIKFEPAFCARGPIVTRPRI